ncbi:MAG: response regulator transcription factor [Pseudomonadota bacterium]
MAYCAYIGRDMTVAKARIDMLQQHHVPVTLSEDIHSIEEDAAIVILDASDLEADRLSSDLQAIVKRGLRVLVIFKLSHGETFRDKRESLLAQGAHDVMEANAPISDLFIRTRAVMLGAKPPFVLVVEDNEKTGPWVVEELRSAGIDARCVTTLAEARECFEANYIDALIVDRQLPDGDGLDFVALLRKNGFRTPALLFTALDSVSDRIRGLSEAGADDYICKPVHGDELVARVMVLLRPRDIEETLIFGPMELNRKDRIVRWRGERIELRPKECDMLIYLAEREGLAIPRRMIYADVWGKVFMDVGSNPVTAARHRLLRDFKSFVNERDESCPDFLITELDAYCFSAEALLQLPQPEPARQ